MTRQDTATSSRRNGLLKRKQTWYARYFVPRALQPIYGRAEVQRTLGTRDIVEARRRLPVVSAELTREVAEFVRKRVPLDLSSTSAVILELQSLEAAVRRGDYSKPAFPQPGSVTQLASSSSSLPDPDLDIVDEVEALVMAYSDRLGAPDPSTGISTRLEPEVWAAAQQTIRSFQDPKYKSLKEWAGLHVEALKAKNLKRSTYLARERHLKDFLRWAGTTRDPRSFTDDDAVSYLDSVNAKHCSARSKKDTVGHVRAFFEWLRKSRRLIQVNLFADLREQIIVSPGDTGTEKRNWKAEELEKIFSGLNPAARLWTISAIALYSGMRINEICTLEVKHVTKRSMQVVRANAKNDNSARLVPIHPILAPLISELAETSYDGFLISGIKPGGQDGRRGAYPSKRFSEVKTRLGLTDPEASFHSFRHSFTTAAERVKIERDTIPLLTGHKRKGITLDRYSDGPEFATRWEALAKVTHDRAASEEGPAVAIDSLVIELLKGYKGNTAWKGKQIADLRSETEPRRN